MKKVVIIGGGIAGMTAGVLLQKAGYITEIYEKNALPGGQCTGWKREGYFIDNCIHWLTGTRPGSALHELWKEIGALGDDVELYKKEMFFSSKLNGQTLTFWRDKERTRKEMLALSPEDEKEINKLIDYVSLAETMTVPVDKPFDAMNPIDFIKLGMSMKEMGKLMKEYENMDINELAMRFKHPLIQRAIIDYMPSGYQAYAFLVSYGTVTGGNGDIPKGGSLAMSLRIAEKYKEYGGILHTNTNVESIILNGKKAEGILLANGNKVKADYVVCACDTAYTFQKLLPETYMPKGLKKMYINREKYPVSSGFQIAYAVDGVFSELTGTRVFSCDEIMVGSQKVQGMSVQSYDYEPDFAPEGKMILQTNFSQSEGDYKYWELLYKDKKAYDSKKAEVAKQAMERVVAEYPFLEGKIHVVDVWTPMTYTRYCNSYKGAYMSFATTKQAKSITVPGVVKGIDNVLLASQWLMGPGGLPTAAAMGKFAAWRIIKRKKRN
ncbi:MAG: NAD(P)/FAD-dependent oxidoreductase [Lachnospiraceae bacterium]|nr:NAD(P)/FAD-dependent oxidoreductase [Lachnospiraceae bacterium]